MSETRIETVVGTFSPKLIRAMFMLLWALSFSTAMAAAKSLSPEVDSLIVLFMKYFLGLVFLALLFFRLVLKTRVVCVGAAMGCTYYADRNLPLALATSIGMTGPSLNISLQNQ